jgi:hypothetical protein
MVIRNVFFLNGDPSADNTYRNGKISGTQIEYYPNRKIKTIKKTNEKMISYRRDGSIQYIVQFNKKTKIKTMITFDNYGRIINYKEDMFNKNDKHTMCIKIYHDNYDSFILEIRHEKNDNSYGKYFSYHENGVLDTYFDWRDYRKGLEIYCESDKSFSSIRYYGKYGYEERLFRNGEISEHNYYSTKNLHTRNEENLSAVYHININTKIAIRKIQKCIRKKYLNKLCQIFRNLTNIYGVLVEIVIEYVFKKTNIFTIDHSLLHVGKI